MLCQSFSCEDEFTNFFDFKSVLRINSSAIFKRKYLAVYLFYIRSNFPDSIYNEKSQITAKKVHKNNMCLSIANAHILCKHVASSDDPDTPERNGGGGEVAANGWRNSF